MAIMDADLEYEPRATSRFSSSRRLGSADVV
jgi:hypothetical protein